MKIYLPRGIITRENIIRAITVLLIFLAGMNFKNMYCYFSLLAFSLFIIFKRKIIVDINVGILVILTISWVFFSPDISKMAFSLMIEPCLYPMAYLVGRNFFAGYSKNNKLAIEEAVIMKVIVIIALAPYVHYLLNYFNNIGYRGRNSIDIWTNTVVSATNQAVMGTMMLAVAISFLLITERMIVKITFMIIVVSVLLYNLMLSGRTLLVILVVVGIACSIYIYRGTPNSVKKMKIAIGIFSFVGISYFLFELNLAGIQDYILNSNLYYRFMYASSEEVFSSERMELKIKYLQNFGLSLWGGRKNYKSGIGYAHDIYLDTYDEAGIFALVAMLTFTVSVFVDVLRCLKKKKLQLSTRVLILALYLAIFMQFMVEPILQGVQWLFTLFCFIHGLVVYLKSISK